MVKPGTAPSIIDPSPNIGERWAPWTSGYFPFSKPSINNKFKVIRVRYFSDDKCTSLTGIYAERYATTDSKCFCYTSNTRWSHSVPSYPACPPTTYGKVEKDNTYKMTVFIVMIVEMIIMKTLMLPALLENVDIYVIIYMSMLI